MSSVDGTSLGMNFVKKMDMLHFLVILFIGRMITVREK